MTAQDSRIAKENHLLAGLPDDVLERLLADSQIHELPIRTILFEPGSDFSRVHFPLSGMISLVSLLRTGDVVEMATVGREGVVGVPMVLDCRPQLRAGSTMAAVCQVKGSSLSAASGDFRRELARQGRLFDLVNRYQNALFVLVGQNAACNRLHSMNQRCARWLLMTHERVGLPTFYLTHEFLSQMLGARRASVTEAAASLQQAGAIRYRRGELTVVDRVLLEQQSCECYGAVRAAFANLYTSPEPSQPADARTT